ncbi:hypothetical protein [Leptothermofonsia sp. ETS-13]|uniref:hypothetical protein n=1 Tax=Leptothermofonsia sp. ETS-13 TaxID=3035696 RepID=UPI003B9EF912
MNTPQHQRIMGRKFLAQSSGLSKHLPSHLLSLLQRTWQACVQTMSTQYEPKVTHKINRQGRITSWQVFDPETGRSISFGSELEVRLWLEQRYYRR